MDVGRGRDLRRGQEQGCISADRMKDPLEFRHRGTLVVPENSKYKFQKVIKFEMSERKNINNLVFLEW